MYARSNTIDARPEAVGGGIAHVRNKVVPALHEIDGFIGLSLLSDLESGRCILTTAWRSAEAMHASADRVRPLRDGVAEAFGGTAAVDEWEIAVLHRDHRAGAGAAVRATWLRARPDQFDRAVDFYRTEVLPALEQFEGFCSASLMLDRDTGRAVTTTSFDSMGAMERTRERARSLRTARLRDLGADQLDTGEFELAVAGLRVPEMV